MNSIRPNEAPARNEWSERQTVHTTVLPKEEARQGVTGHNVRYVLSFGLAAIALAFVLIYLVYFG